MTKLLTLSISETWQNSYKVVAYDIDNHLFNALEIHESQFKNPEGSTAWDLFGLTTIDGLEPTRGEFKRPIGMPKVEKYYSNKEMIEFFHRKKMPAQRFFNGRFDYGIVKVDSIEKIHPPQMYDKLSQKIDFTSGGKIHRNIKNKDFKWLQYWSQIPEKEYENKIDQWTKYFQENDKEMFLVLYYYNRYSHRWIVGFHCL